VHYKMSVVTLVWVWMCVRTTQLDGNHIIARLMEIRDYTQQAASMLDALGTHSDSVIIAN